MFIYILKHILLYKENIYFIIFFFFSFKIKYLSINYLYIIQFYFKTYLFNKFQNLNIKKNKNNKKNIK